MKTNLLRMIMGCLPVIAMLSCTKDITNAYIEHLVACIPNHALDTSVSGVYTQEYYSLLAEAWAIPTDNPGGIGSEERLYYFMSGNGEDYKDVEVQSKQVNGNKVQVKFNCIYNDKSLQEHTLELLYVNNCWLIANLDSTQSMLYDYITNMRAYFRSPQWVAALADNEYLSNEEKEAAKNAVEQYFKLYPADRP